MISYVPGSLMTPSWWMPEACAKAFAPTTALFGWTGVPVSSATRRDARVISFVFTPHSRPSFACRTLSSITISSSDVFPARSPMPLIVHSTWRAPAAIAASELAAASPRSL